MEDLEKDILLTAIEKLVKSAPIDLLDDQEREEMLKLIATLEN